ARLASNRLGNQSADLRQVHDIRHLIQRPRRPRGKDHGRMQRNAGEVGGKDGIGHRPSLHKPSNKRGPLPVQSCTMRRSKAERPRLCFRCGYTLPSEPDQATCPECGLSNLRVEAATSPRWITPLCAAIAAIVPFVYLVWWFNDQCSDLSERMG